jgi:TonB family protein
MASRQTPWNHELRGEPNVSPEHAAMTELRIVARRVLMLAGTLACAGALAQAVPSDQAASAADRAQKQADRTLYWIRVLAEKPAAPKPAAKPAAAPVQAAAPAAAPRAVAAAADSRPPAQKVASVLAPLPSEAGGAPAVVAAPPAATAPAVPLAGAAPRGMDSGVASPAVSAGLAAPALTAPSVDVPQQADVEEPDPGLVMIKSADPQFPMSTMRRLRKGEVEVKFEVGPDGQVDVVSVVRSTNPGLNNAALEAVRQWQFKPTPRGHTAVVDLAFDLDS